MLESGEAPGMRPLVPASADDLADAVRTVFQRSAAMENFMAATNPQHVPRLNIQARLAMLRTALAISTPRTRTPRNFLLHNVLD